MKKLLTICLILIPALAWAQFSPRLGNLRDQVRARLGHPDNTTLPDSVLRHFINEGMIRVAVDCGAVRKKDTITLVAGTAFYTANTDAIEGWPIDVIGHQPSKADAKSKWWGLQWLIPQSWKVADEDNARVFTGYVHAGEIALYPPPNVAGSLYIYYRAMPTAFTGEGDTSSTCSVPEVDRPGAIEYAVFQAASSLEWPEKREMAKMEYDRHVAERQRDMVVPRYVGPQKPQTPSGPVQP